MQKNIVFVALILAAMFVLPTGGMAALMGPVEGPVSGNSWSIIGWFVNGTGWEGVEAFIINDSGTENANFESPGITNLSEAGWSGNVINSDYAFATGPATTLDPLSFGTLFTGTAADQYFQIDFLFYDSGGLAFGASRLWNGSDVELATWNPATVYDRSVPEPSTLLLIGAGLAGVGVARRRFKN